jgi:hypothetical protein
VGLFLFPGHHTGKLNVIRVIKSRKMRWSGHVACTGDTRNVHKFVVGTSAGRRIFERPNRRWENIIKIDLRETGREGVDWVHVQSGQGPLAGSCEHGNAKSGSIKGGEFD